MRSVHVPERFAASIVEAVVTNLVGLDGAPVICGIFGPPGQGKSFQLRVTCETLGVRLIVLDAADLESDRAGLPGKFVRAEYRRAADLIRTGVPAALLVDDFDTTGGEWEHHTGTVNHLQVLAELMHIADEPHVAAANGPRPPIFLTGNDFSKLYPPLKRPGRMRSLHWSPDRQERLETNRRIFGQLLAPATIEILLDTHPSQPTSFWVEVKAAAVARRCSQLVIALSEDLGLVCRAPERYRSMLEVELARTPLDEEVITVATHIAEQKELQSMSFIEAVHR